MVVWRGPIWPVGADGDYAIAVEATAGGAVRSQRRAGLERCDGAPARLFAEAYGARFRVIPAGDRRR